MDRIRRDGFAADMVGTMVGASGGAKWLVLSQLDRYLLSHVVPQFKGPVHLLGSSIGSWRFACYGQRDALAAINRFEQAYIEQSFSDNPDRAEISALTRRILQVLLGDTGVEEALSHPVFRTHVMTVRARHFATSENSFLLGGSLLVAALLNIVSRRSLGLSYERALFYDSRDIPPFHDLSGFPMQTVPMSADNYGDAVLATGAIPLVIEGVRDIVGATPGVYRDGGVIDYHHDLETSEPGRLTLYPHFYPYIIPGWFDKKLSWRRADGRDTQRTVLISPSPEFVQTLPGRKIPDRTDFMNYSQTERVRVWREVVSACEALADELADVLENGRLAERLEPL
ncbi:MAG: patatin-like phospholipase family protein [Pseudomonadota bacterium]